MSAPIDLEQLYDAHAQALFGFLLNLTRHEMDTCDLLQGIFVKLAQQPGLLAQARDERAYLLGLAYHAAIDLSRRRDTRERYHEAQAAELVELFAPASDPDEAAFRRALADAMSALPAEQRAVVHLKLWEDRTFDAIAQMLDISPNTAASRYRYAIDKLRVRLRPIYDEIR